MTSFSRPTNSSVSSKKSNFSIFWQIFTHFPVNFGIKIFAFKSPFFWYYLHSYLSNISVPNWSLEFVLVDNSSLVYRLQSRFLSGAAADSQLKSNLNCTDLEVYKHFFEPILLYLASLVFTALLTDVCKRQKYFFKKLENCSF